MSLQIYKSIKVICSYNYDCLTDVAAMELRIFSTSVVAPAIILLVCLEDKSSDQSMLVNTPSTPATANPKKHTRTKSRYYKNDNSMTNCNLPNKEVVTLLSLLLASPNYLMDCYTKSLNYIIFFYSGKLIYLALDSLVLQKLNALHSRTAQLRNRKITCPLMYRGLACQAMFHPDKE